MKTTACLPDFGLNLCQTSCNFIDILQPECPSCFGQGEYEEEQDFRVPCYSCSSAGYYVIYQKFPCGTNTKQCNHEQ